MSYSFLLVSGRANTVTVPVGSASNGQSAVLHRKNSTLSSTGVIANGKATFDIPTDRVTEFAGTYSITVGSSVIQNGDIDIVNTGGSSGGGGGDVDLSNYFTKAQTSSTVASAVSSKADLTYVNNQLSTKAGLADLDNKVDAAVIKPVAFSGNFADLTGRPDLSTYATTSNLTAGLAGKANTSDVNSALAAKADTSTVNSSLAGKVSTSDLTTALSGKADTSAVNTSLAAKANTADVYTKSAADAKFALIGQGGGGANNVLVLGPSDPVPANTATGTIIVRKAS